MSDVAKQARQGSVAAIIQILNEQLADLGVRTRAVIASGVLQILCEASTVEQLEQEQVVARVQQILEEISPFGLRRVQVNSRLVREQQMLWLEEINRDRENQLLWSEEILLRRPNVFQGLKQSLEMLQTNSHRSKDWSRNDSHNSSKGVKSFWGGLLGGLILSLLLIASGWMLYRHRASIPQLGTALGKVLPEDAPVTPQEISTTRQVSSPPPAVEPFAQAVELATEASAKGKSAQTSAQWLEIAAKWQLASDLMAKIPSTDPRYNTAQDRVVFYRRNSDIAQKQAKVSRSQE